MENDENRVDVKVAKDVIFSMYWGPSGTFNRDMGFDVKLSSAEYETYEGIIYLIRVRGVETCDKMSMKYYSLNCMENNSYTRMSTTGSNCLETSDVTISLNHK